RDSAGRHRASMHLVERRFLRGRRLSAGATDGSGAAEQGSACQGADDDSEGRGAEDRSCAGRGRAAGKIVEAHDLKRDQTTRLIIATLARSNIAKRRRKLVANQLGRAAYRRTARV